MPRKSRKPAEPPVSDTAADAPAQSPPPSALGEARNAAGQFLPGNAGGPGNPHARHCARMLELFRNAISDEEMYMLTRVLLERASTGDMSAMKMIWQYKLGKPLPAPNPDAIDRDEWDHFQKDAMTLTELKNVLNQLPSRIGNAIASAALPSIAESVAQNLSAQLFQSLPPDYYAQSATPPAADAPGQSAPMPAAPDAQPTPPGSNGFSAEPTPVSNGDPVELDADGLPSRGLPNSLPASPSPSAPRPQPSTSQSTPVSNGKSKKGGKGGKSPKSRKRLKNQWMASAAKNCQASKKSSRRQPAHV
jgi:hypothetical protein